MRGVKLMRRLLLLGALVGVAVFAMPAAAVTDGELDGDGHPAVVLLLMEVGGQPAFRCSATLLSATVVLTAGHCTSNYPDEPYTSMRVFVESDVDNGDNNYPFAGPNAYEAASWAAHPLYETGPFFLHDVGVVVLAGSGVPTSVIPASAYGTLPDVDQLDVLATKRGQHKATFTSVGYGRQKSFPTAAAWKNQAARIRMVAHPKLNQINAPGFTGDFSLLLSNNAHTGGTCFGDSGGPNFLGDSSVVAGVTSFGLNATCGGTGGVFRMDRQNVLDFVGSFLS